MFDISNVHRPFSVAFLRREIEMFKIEMLGTQHVAPFVLLLQNYFYVVACFRDLVQVPPGQSCRTLYTAIQVTCLMVCQSSRDCVGRDETGWFCNLECLFVKNMEKEHYEESNEMQPKLIAR